MAAPKLAPGLVFEDDWYAVQQIDEGTFAIGEPLYYQQNWSYLLIGEERALMFDTGSFSQDITLAIQRRLNVPLIALPSHMHFDHLGNVHRFDHVCVADLPMLRDCETDGWLTPTEDIFLGSYEDRKAPRFRVSEWLALESWIELGGRRLQVVHTPGHSADSVSLLEPAKNRMYAADFLYNGEVYGQTPGADLADYLAAAEALIERLPGTVSIYGAHGNVAEDEAHSAPSMDRQVLEALARTLASVRDICAGWDDAAEWSVDIDAERLLRISPEAIAAWRV